QLGRRQRIGNEIPDIRIPPNNIHLLVIEFADDVFHPLSPKAYASANRINLLIAGPNRQFRPEPGLAGDALDFNGAIVDFRHLELEQLYDKTRVGPRKNNLRSMRPLLDRLHIAANPFAYLIFLSRDAFTVGKQGLVFA